MPLKPLDSDLSLTDAEMSLVKKIAEVQGVTDDEAASSLISEAMARRVKKRTGKTPAKVYDIRRK